MWIVTFRPQYCWSSSGDRVDRLCITLCSTVVVSDWCVSILTAVVCDWWILRNCSLIGPLWYRLAVVLFDREHPRKKWYVKKDLLYKLEWITRISFTETLTLSFLDTVKYVIIYLSHVKILMMSRLQTSLPCFKFVDIQ